MELIYNFFNYLKFNGTLFGNLETVNNFEVMHNLLGGCFIGYVVVMVGVTLYDFFQFNEEWNFKISIPLLITSIVLNTTYSFLIFYFIILINSKFVGIYVVLTIVVWIIQGVFGFIRHDTDQIGGLGLVSSLVSYNDNLIKHLKTMTRWQKDYDDMKNTNLNLK